MENFKTQEMESPTKVKTTLFLAKTQTCPQRNKMVALRWMYARSKSIITTLTQSLKEFKENVRLTNDACHVLKSMSQPESTDARGAQMFRTSDRLFPLIGQHQANRHGILLTHSVANSLGVSGGRIQHPTSSDSSRMLHSNLLGVIEELRPLMADSTAGITLPSWLRRGGGDPAPSLPVTDPQQQHRHQHDGDSFVITLEHEGVQGPAAAQTAADNFLNNIREAATTTSEQSHAHNNNNNNIEEGAAEILRQSPETRAVLSVLQKYLPFLLILFAKGIYDHRAGILIFIGLFVTFSRANSVVQREIAKQGRRSLTSLLIIVCNLLGCILFIYYIFQDQKLYLSLVFIPPYSQPLSMWDLLWIVGVTDFVLKLITIIFKVGVAALPVFLLPYQKRGKCYLFLEASSQLYRSLVPIQPWLYYLLESYQGPEKVVGVFLSAAYMVSKGSDLMAKGKLWRDAFWKLLQNMSVGVSPNKEQLQLAGSQCPICHDEYDAPVLLHCRHIFCEACVATWFDRVQTCPLCRAKVVDDPAWRDGTTTYFTQLY